MLSVTLIAASCILSHLQGAQAEEWNKSNEWAPPLHDLKAATTEMAPAWVAGPRTRGTFEILSSCIFTLALCVYTAIHLNVPPQGESIYRNYVRITKWVLIALVAPEIVLYAAVLQFRLARKFCTAYNSIVNEHQRHFPRDKISLEEGFYAVMGGYIVDISSPSDNSTTPSSSTLTVDALIKLASEFSFTSVSREAIRDKSKADFLAKFLVCFQVSFLVVQSIARKIQGYPLALLEIHTLVHVGCAFLMYALWFHKPLNVYTPTTIAKTETVRRLFSSEVRDNSLFLESRARNISVMTWADIRGAGALKPHEVLMLLLTLLVLVGAYGGIHMGVTVRFPTDIETQLWK
ncbi:hypothetical protein EDC01DRAFT_39180 [Geopyxis carbonaria]|nr:hypothetical protein EDC01DRAFT_39180 [Geopyxis carbonaria]